MTELEWFWVGPFAWWEKRGEVDEEKAEKSGELIFGMRKRGRV